MFLVASFLLTLVFTCWGDEDAENAEILKLTQLSEDDRCTFIECETPNWKQDKCCPGYVCILPDRFGPIQRPRCEQKKFLPGFGYNFGYERLILDSNE